MIYSYNLFDLQIAFYRVIVMILIYYIMAFSHHYQILIFDLMKKLLYYDSLNYDRQL